MSATKGQPDHVVHLLIAAGSDATSTLNATLQLNGDRRMGNIRTGLSSAAKTACTHVEFVTPLIKFRCLGVAGFANLTTQQLKYQRLRIFSAGTVTDNAHSIDRCPTTRRCQHPLTLDLYHTRATVAGGGKAICVAQMGNLYLFAPCDLQDTLARACTDLAAI